LEHLRVVDPTSKKHQLELHAKFIPELKQIWKIRIKHTQKKGGEKHFCISPPQS